MKCRRLLFSLFLLSIPTVALGQAHFAPGVADIRDYTMPGPGLYFATYNYDYDTSELTDNSGNKVNQVAIGNTPVNVNIHANIYALSPMLLFVSNVNILSGHFGAFIAPAFSNANIGASLSTLNGLGINPSTSQFAVGDLYVNPVWLGWTFKHFDVTGGYGFYAPIGKFNTKTIPLPSGPRVVTAATNVGLGYWTNQLQGNLAWYPSPKRGTAIVNTLTAELNGKQRDTNFTNGEFLTWSWGASQFIPLDKQVQYLAQLGVMGYNQWQVTDSSGPNVSNPSFHQHDYAVGLQAGIISIRAGMQLNFLYQHEYSVANRLRGSSYSFNLGFTIQQPKPVPAP